MTAKSAPNVGMPEPGITGYVLMTSSAPRAAARRSRRAAEGAARPLPGAGVHALSAGPRDPRPHGPSRPLRAAPGGPPAAGRCAPRTPSRYAEIWRRASSSTAPPVCPAATRPSRCSTSTCSGCSWSTWHCPECWTAYSPASPYPTSCSNGSWRRSSRRAPARKPGAGGGEPRSDQALRSGCGSRHIGHIRGPSGRSRGRPVRSKPRRS